MTNPVVQGVENLATQKVVGYSARKRTVSKKGTVKEEIVSVGIQAWELGILLAAVAVYDYVEGPGSVASTIKHPYSAGLFALPASGSLGGLP